MPGFSVPWSNTPTAGFADTAFPIKGKLPVNGPRFAGKRAGIPTDMAYREPPK